MSFLIAPFVQAEVAYRHERIRRDFTRPLGLLGWLRTPRRTSAANVTPLPTQRPSHGPTAASAAATGVGSHDSHHAAA